MHQPYQPPQPPAPQPKKKHRKWPWITVGVFAFFLLMGLIGSLTNPQAGTSTPSNAAVQATTQATRPSAPAPITTTTPAATTTAPLTTTTVAAPPPVTTYVAPAAPKTTRYTPPRTTTRHTTQAAAPPVYTAPVYTAPPAPAPTQQQTSKYRAGEFCSAADLGETVLATNGRPITCEADNGYNRWVYS